MTGRLVVFLLLSLAAASAQRDFTNNVLLVRVRVAFADGTCDASDRVTLSAHNGPVIEGSQNNHCEVDFTNVPEGEYRVNVVGKDSASSDTTSDIYVSSTGPAEFDIQLKRATTFDRSGIFANSFVSASDLAVPDRARKELDKAVELFHKQDLQHAMQKLNKAIAIYPQYAMAYNDMGAIYSRLGDSARESQALQKAINLDPNLELAYLNLGRMHVRQGHFPAAETALNKAVGLNAKDPAAIVLLAYSQFMDSAFESAIATSQKAHSLDQPHATAHRIAGLSFAMQSQGQNAIAELETFLQEEPTGEHAAAAREEIKKLKMAMGAQP